MKFKNSSIDINSLFVLQQLLQNCCGENFSKAMEDLEICKFSKNMCCLKIMFGVTAMAKQLPFG